MKTVLFLLAASGVIYSDMVAENVLDSLIKKDRPFMSYHRYCSSCHGSDGLGVNGSPLGKKALNGYETISELFRYIKRSHIGKMDEFSGINNIEIIYASRFAKERLP